MDSQTIPSLLSDHQVSQWTDRWICEIQGLSCSTMWQCKGKSCQENSQCHWHLKGRQSLSPPHCARPVLVAVRVSPAPTSCSPHLPLSPFDDPALSRVMLPGRQREDGSLWWRPRRSPGPLTGLLWRARSSCTSHSTTSLLDSLAPSISLSSNLTLSLRGYFTTNAEALRRRQGWGECGGVKVQ